MIARQREIERELRLDGLSEVRQDFGSLVTVEEFAAGDDEPEFDEELPAAA